MLDEVKLARDKLADAVTATLVAAEKHKDAFEALDLAVTKAAEAAAADAAKVPTLDDVKALIARIK